MTLVDRAAQAIRDSGEGCLSGLVYIDAYAGARAVISLVNQWQAIETAPRDDTRILLFRRRKPAMKDAVVIGRWKGLFWALDRPGNTGNAAQDDDILGWQALPSEIG